jgi:lipopolysaccharide transport system ATP-binding protein
MRAGGIRVEGLSKRYALAGRRPAYRTLRDTLAESLAAVWRAGRGNRSSPDEPRSHWALQDVSFEVRPGEVVGLIGRNGAGKSTLLKVLSRITDPTAGRAMVAGRVASLLEVGTGFHGELSGRENVFLNGAILGMSRREIAAKLDAIVAFAEVEKFLDTPVKHYSSGMYLRLGFSVAAHLEPEILFVDEVLAVGDAEFQRRCLGKMEAVARQGRTVLFVSHNMAAVRLLCQRGLLLAGGRVAFDGAIGEATSRYLAGAQDHGGERTWAALEEAPGNDVVRLRAVRLRDESGAMVSEVLIHTPLRVEIEYAVLKPGYPLDAFCYFIDDFGATRFVSIDNVDSPWRDGTRPPGLYRSTCHVPGDLLNEGLVRLHVLVNSSGSRLHAVEHDALVFRVVDDMDPRGVRGNYPQSWPEAALRPRLRWEVERLGEAPDGEGSRDA